MQTEQDWRPACQRDEIELEDVLGVEIEGQKYAIYRSADDRFYATEGLCTHEQVNLADGLVMGNIIECPKHNGRFDYRTGEAKGAPVCINLRTVATRVDGDMVYIAV